MFSAPLTSRSLRENCREYVGHLVRSNLGCIAESTSLPLRNKGIVHTEDISPSWNVDLTRKRDITRFLSSDTSQRRAEVKSMTRLNLDLLLRSSCSCLSDSETRCHNEVHCHGKFFRCAVEFLLREVWFGHVLDLNCLCEEHVWSTCFVF